MSKPPSIPPPLTPLAISATWFFEKDTLRPRLPEGEELHRLALSRYWNDAEFHARCFLLTEHLAHALGNVNLHLIVEGLFLDDIVRETWLNKEKT